MAKSPIGFEWHLTENQFQNALKSKEPNLKISRNSFRTKKHAYIIDMIHNYIHAREKGFSLVIYKETKNGEAGNELYRIDEIKTATNLHRFIVRAQKLILLKLANITLEDIEDSDWQTAYLDKTLKDDQETMVDAVQVQYRTYADTCVIWAMKHSNNLNKKPYLKTLTDGQHVFATTEKLLKKLIDEII